MKSRYGVYFLLIAAGIAIFTAFAHLSCIIFGPQCYAFQMAPTELLASAENGTWLAPVATVIVSGVFLVWAMYATSAAGLIRPLPLLKLVVYSISVLSIVRGLLGIQLWIRRPELVSVFSASSSVIWLFFGLLFLFGYLNMRGKQKTR